MSRPQKNNADYFPHQTSMRNHRKIKMLRNKFGSVLGYAFWSMMLEWLTEKDGLEWLYSEIEIEMFAAELGVSAAEIPPIVDFCLKIDLLFLNEGFIYSESLNQELNPVFEKRKTERKKSIDRLRKENGTFKKQQKPTTGGVSAAETPQSRVEYSREEEIKKEYIRNDIFENEILSFFGFNQIANPDKQRDIFEACTAFFHSDRLEYFTKQFKYYKLVKSADDPKYKHSLGTFLGNQSEEFKNGKWDAENWELKFVGLNAAKSKPTATAVYTKPTKAIRH